MSTLSTVPEVVDLACYAGDTLVIAVTLEAGFADGATWSAHVRAATGDPATVAVFQVTPPPTPGEPASLMLTGAQTAALVVDVIRFVGVWDVQVSDAGIDPITTLARGTFTVSQDVTRP